MAHFAELRTTVNQAQVRWQTSGSSTLDFGGLFAFADAVVRVYLTVERLRIMNSARMEFAPFFLLQERTTFRGEQSAQTAGVAGINR